MDAYKKMVFGSSIIAIMLIIPFIIYFFFIRHETPPPDPLPSSSEIRTSVPPVKEIIKKTDSPEPLTLNIELNNSDEKLRQLLRSCSSHPGFSGWLKNVDIIRRFVAVVDNIANGTSPAPHLEFLSPSGKFKVFKRIENFYLDPVGYKRYDSTASILASLNSKKLVEIYQQTKPLMEEAFKELGYPEKGFVETLLQAFSVLLNTHIPEGDILLEEKVMVYAFKDPGLEHLSAVQKHLIRMGPKNGEKIKAKLREIISEIRGKR